VHKSSVARRFLRCFGFSALSPPPLLAWPPWIFLDLRSLSLPVTARDVARTAARRRRNVDKEEK